MNREIAELWIADLRSNPPQARERLFNGIGHCCLGRLCILKGLVPEVQEDEESKAYYFDGSQFTLPQSVQNWAGMKTAEGKYKNRVIPEKALQLSWPSVDLTQENDMGKTFAEIADIIEAHIDEL